jgi:hypothetical protein
MHAYGLNKLAEELKGDYLVKFVDSEFQSRVVKALLPFHAQRVSETSVVATPDGKNTSNKFRKSQEPDLFNS